MYISTELILSILMTIILINQIIIILEKEKLEEKITIILKIIHKKPLTKKESECVREFKR